MIYQLRDGYFVRPLAALDLDGPYPAWFEDQEICRYNSHGKFFPTRAALLAYIENDATDRVVWAICDGNQTHVGNVSLQHISFVNRSAEFADLAEFFFCRFHDLRVRVYAISICRAGRPRRGRGT